MISKGIINLNKPANMTSHDCVNVLRRLTGVKRIGHTGTLDPMATGVLPLCIGPSTRVAEYLEMDFKKYRCTLVFGLETDTQDIWGKTVSDEREELKIRQKKVAAITEEKINCIVKDFNGLITQIPPKYSALKVNGKKLYEYARAGIEVEIKSRQVYIKDFTVNSIDFEQMTLGFDVTCSKGTYIRTICVDIGHKLGVAAAMSSLIRLESGAFTVENAVTMEQLMSIRTSEDVRDPNTGRYIEYGRADEEKLKQLLFPTDFPLIYFGEFNLPEDRAVWFVTGGHIAVSEGKIISDPLYKMEEPPFKIREEYKKAYKMYTVKESKKKFLGVAFYNTTYNKLVADKIFLRGLEDADF
ncbi:MAG TPA: tRNA pseudouridine(55) synthase TruB [Anaerovoracaceae bacterium]|nr:tRNA pseudouridine(55) synthase TruB [Anaerovoracaceae bacterium]